MKSNCAQGSIYASTFEAWVRTDVSAEHSSITACPPRAPEWISPSPDPSTSSPISLKHKSAVGSTGREAGAKLRKEPSEWVEVWVWSSVPILTERRLASWRLMRKRETRIAVRLYVSGGQGGS